MKILIETYHRLLEDIKPLYKRKFYDDFSFDHRVMGIVGGRGVGKTSFILHYLKQNYGKSEKALYVSADHLYFSKNTLLGLVDQFYKDYAGELICIDEIHKYKNWNQELKNIYDSYPQIKILFSGSSSIDLVKGKYDLSRRALLKHISGFSFREFLEYKLKKEFPILTLKDIVNKGISISKEIGGTPRLLGFLKEYREQGYYPFFTELIGYEAYQEIIMDIINKTVYQDISTFYSLKTKNLDAFKKILYFLATSSPGSVNINKLAKSLNKDHTTISEYLEMLKESGMLRYLLRDKLGHALIRNAEKIYINNTNLLYAINNTIGKILDIGVVRELFAVQQLEDAGYTVCYSKNGDIQCKEYVFEIGGKSKSKKQIQKIKNAYVIKDNILIASPKEIPLYLLGFLY